MAQITDLNVSPYYDDFDEGKNFHRLLFRPGFAVQARELTQLQSILQNQIDRFGEHIFKEGSVVRGCELVYESDISYVKLRDNPSIFGSQIYSKFLSGLIFKNFFILSSNSFKSASLKPFARECIGLKCDDLTNLF